MVDREELLQVDVSPFTEDMLTRYYAYEVPCSFTVRYLYMVMLCRYLEKLNQKYDWQIHIEQFQVFLNDKMIRENSMEDDFYCVIETGFQLWRETADRFGWEVVQIPLEIFEDGMFQAYQKGDESLISYLHSNTSLTEKEIRMLLDYETILDEAVAMDGICEVYVMEHEQLGSYLNFRETHKELISESFAAEDEKIMELTNYWIGHPLYLQFARNQKCEKNHFIAAFVCGYDGSGEVDFDFLSPEWVIACFVVHELLQHAEALFHYQEAK